MEFRPTPDGAGLEFEIPAPRSVARLEWLAGEILVLLQDLKTLPLKRPESGLAKDSPFYAAGLKDMADFLLEKIKHDIQWQSMRSFLGDAFDLPENSSELSRHRPAKED